MFDLHRHDEFSTFDGFGNALELAQLAKELGYESLCTTNHGNTNGLIQTYNACKQVGIKPILGVEGYFLPVWKDKQRGYHMCMIAKNLVGYGNINRMQFDGEHHKYYNPIWSFKTLEKYHEGCICTTACVAGYLSQALLKGADKQAERFLRRLKEIFGSDLYVEIQPYSITDRGVQEKVNKLSWRLAKRVGVECILTSDSHRGRKEDFATYMMMHAVANHNFDDIEGTYKERYMPKPDELKRRFMRMHGHSFKTKGQAMAFANRCYRNLDKIESQCEPYYLDDLPLLLPKLHDGDKSSMQVLIDNVRHGLRNRGVYKPEYIARCKEELKVIKHHGFEDYFLMVADYTVWAKEHGIGVGPGRGSVCNCLVAYALYITEVDSLYFGLDFRRFLRMDKSTFPDIDLDFVPTRRYDVIQYICDKYKGKAARICSYGLYKVDNLMNDLAKACFVGNYEVDEKGNEKFVVDRKELSAIKSFANTCINDDETINYSLIETAPQAREWNRKYNDILVHFAKLYRKVRFIGKHAAGVAVTDGDILDYTALSIEKDGGVLTAYDLTDLDSINLVKFDILGLKTMESIMDLRESTGVTVDYREVVKDKRIFKAFREGNCDGVFQFEKNTVRGILEAIDCDCFDDLCAANAMNRPGPLQQGMPDMYAANKRDTSEAEQSAYWQYTSNTYGTIVYQEQVMQICVNLGGMEWSEADEIMKLMKHTDAQAGGQEVEKRRKRKAELGEKFISHAIENGMEEREANALYENLFSYTFNQGHATGYSLIAVEEMFYKIYYPTDYWFAKLKYARDMSQYRQFAECAVADGAVVFLPHVNYSTEGARIRMVDGEKTIQQGLQEIKNVGEKAAQEIVAERKRGGIFTSLDNFIDRCMGKGKKVNKRVLSVLQENGVLEFNKKRYIQRVTKYNSTLLASTMH